MDVCPIVTKLYPMLCGASLNLEEKKMPSEQYVEGPVLKVSHERKGVFVIQVNGQDDTWVQATMIEGETRARLRDNVKYEGEPVSLRKSFTRILEVLSPKV